ncbi:hypothetical protein BAUCODRAFT_22495 [Baudoinia panamericana UAMH 10762]|uniref:BRCT domain-containing protein n=1 Tax=Baudoinia panamericana (strain UAMH 10762) TaxID=717646 RepID=M2MQX0_BAUPA|nr:uncharacterized protein BAUCODRAFT_22495 [Baudoinia panamericana UAMH 10762]EMC99231.1 hypothetical protein BAUCODRAFT_22495 [Baudoinia panamericana UAMH 10762]
MPPPLLQIKAGSGSYDADVESRDPTMQPKSTVQGGQAARSLFSPHDELEAHDEPEDQDAPEDSGTDEEDDATNNSSTISTGGNPGKYGTPGTTTTTLDVSTRTIWETPGVKDSFPGVERNGHPTTSEHSEGATPTSNDGAAKHLHNSPSVAKHNRGSQQNNTQTGAGTLARNVDVISASPSAADDKSSQPNSPACHSPAGETTTGGESGAEDAALLTTEERADFTHVVEDSQNIVVASKSAISHEADMHLEHTTMTSESPTEHGTAHEAAKRSVQQKNLKRARKAADKLDTARSGKRQRTRRAAPALGEPDSDAASVDKGPRRSGRAAPKRRKPSKTTATADVCDELDTATAKRGNKRTGKSAPPAQITAPPDSPGATPTSSATPTAQGKLARVLLSQTAVKNDSKAIKWLKSMLTVTEEVPTRRSNFACVVGRSLPTTAKVLRTIALGKPVITENWVSQSQIAKELLDPTDYLHPGVRDTAGDDRSLLFQGKTLFFTNALHAEYGEGWSNIKALANECGASRVEKGTAGKASEVTPRSEVIIFGRKENDESVLRLTMDGRTVYQKDLLTQSVLRNALDLESDEFMLTGHGGKADGKRKK